MCHPQPYLIGYTSQAQWRWTTQRAVNVYRLWTWGRFLVFNGALWHSVTQPRLWLNLPALWMFLKSRHILWDAVLEHGEQEGVWQTPIRWLLSMSCCVKFLCIICVRSAFGPAEFFTLHLEGIHIHRGCVHLWSHSHKESFYYMEGCVQS